MIFLLILLWVGCLSCHAGLQPARYRLPDLPARDRVLLQVVRAGAPVLALGVALWDGVVCGILLWCATFSIAGLLVAGGIAIRPTWRKR